LLRIESLLRTLGDSVIERSGSSITVEPDGINVRPHRRHPRKESLPYRVRDVRDLPLQLGVMP
jgi:hypothetical protein